MKKPAKKEKIMKEIHDKVIVLLRSEGEKHDLEPIELIPFICMMILKGYIDYLHALTHNKEEDL